MLYFRQLRARFVLEKVALGHVLSLVSIVTTSLHIPISFKDLLFPHPVVQEPLVGQGLLIVEASRSHSDTHTLSWSPLDEWPGRRRDPYLATHNTHKRQTSTPRRDSKPQSYKARGRRPMLEAFADH